MTLLKLTLLLVLITMIALPGCGSGNAPTNTFEDFTPEDWAKYNAEKAERERIIMEDEKIATEREKNEPELIDPVTGT